MQAIICSIKVLFVVEQEEEEEEDLNLTEGMRNISQRQQHFSWIRKGFLIIQASNK